MICKVMRLVCVLNVLFFQLEMDEGHGERRPLPAPSSARTWRSPTRPVSASPPSRFFEELFCSSRTSAALVPLAGALAASSSGPRSDVVKTGYLGMLERDHRRYFVLRAGSHTGPSRLEWYGSQEAFAAAEKSAGRAALFGSSRRGLVKVASRCRGGGAALRSWS